MERLNWGWKKREDGNLSRQVQTSLLIFHESWHFREIDRVKHKKRSRKVWTRIFFWWNEKGQKIVNKSTTNSCQKKVLGHQGVENLSK